MQVDEVTERVTIPQLVSMIVLATLLLALPELRGSDAIFRHVSGMRLLVCALELAFVLSVAIDSRIRWPSLRDVSPSVKWLGVGWAVWTMLSVVFANHPAPAVFRQAEWWTTVVFGVSLWSFLQTYPHRRGLVYLAVPAGLVLYGWYLLGFTFDPRTLAAFRWSYFEGFEHIRHFGYYTAIALPLAAAPLVAVSAGRSEVSRITVAFSLVATFVALVLMFGAGGRGPVFALALSVAAVVLGRLVRVSWPLVIGAVVLTVASGLATYAIEPINPGLGIQSIVGRSMAAGNFDQLSSGRGELWRLTLEAVRGAPMFGAGPDGYMLLARPGFERTVQPHNVVLMFLLEWGVLGCMLAVALIASLLRRAYGLARNASDDGHAFRRLGAFWCVLTVLALGLVDGPLYHAHALMLATVAMTLSVLAPREQSEQAQPMAVRRTRTRITVGVLAAVLASIVAAHAEVRRTLHADRPPSPDSVRARLLRSFPCDDMRRTEGPFQWARELLASDPAAALEWVEFGGSRARRPYHFAYLEALIRLEQQDHDEARSSIARALDGCLAPTHRGFKARSVEARHECDTLRAMAPLVEAGVLEGASLELDQDGLLSAVRVTDDDAATALRQALPNVTITR